jgi:hypothetical protein
MNRHQVSAAFLVILGTGRIIGEFSGFLPLQALAAAVGASPAPKVFSAVRGLETFSTRFFIEWPGRRIELTPEIYSHMRGPYNRRNVYGAALAYAPVIPSTLRDPVMRYALCGDAPLLRELGVDLKAAPGPVVLVIEPLPGTSIGDLATHFQVSCPDAERDSGH